MPDVSPNIEQDPTNVFVYGTLLFPEITNRLRIVSRGLSQLRRAPATLRGYERFTVNARGSADPPAIIPAEEKSVEGHILLDITEESLATLDWFEGIEDELYTRERVRVELNNSELQQLVVYTYVCGETIRTLLNGDWDPQRFQQRDLEWYLANVIPKERIPHST